MIFSIGLDTTEFKRIGRSFSVKVFNPFLCSGVVLSNFHWYGIFASWSVLLKMSVSGLFTSLTVSKNNFGW